MAALVRLVSPFTDTGRRLYCTIQTELGFGDAWLYWGLAGCPTRSTTMLFCLVHFLNERKVETCVNFISEDTRGKGSSDFINGQLHLLVLLSAEWSS